MLTCVVSPKKMFGMREAFSLHEKTEIHQKSSEINVLENGPGQLGRLAEALGMTKDDN